MLLSNDLREFYCIRTVPLASMPDEEPYYLLNSGRELVTYRKRFWSQAKNAFEFGDMRVRSVGSCFGKVSYNRHGERFRFLSGGVWRFETEPAALRQLDVLRPILIGAQSAIFRNLSERPDVVSKKRVHGRQIGKRFEVVRAAMPPVDGDNWRPLDVSGALC